MKVSPIKNQTNTNFRGVGAARILEAAAGINSWQQRALLGGTAIILQPIIDLKNKDVDPMTRKVSANRSIAKGIVGTATGIVIRGACMKGVQKALSKEKWCDKLARLVAADNSIASIEKTKDFIKNQGGAKQYASVIGTSIALGVIVFTNFLVDMPLTNVLTNFLNSKLKKEDENPPKEGAGNGG